MMYGENFDGLLLLFAILLLFAMIPVGRPEGPVADRERRAVIAAAGSPTCFKGPRDREIRLSRKSWGGNKVKCTCAARDDRFACAGRFLD